MIRWISLTGGMLLPCFRDRSGGVPAGCIELVISIGKKLFSEKEGYKKHEEEIFLTKNSLFHFLRPVGQNQCQATVIMVSAFQFNPFEYRLPASEFSIASLLQALRF